MPGAIAKSTSSAKLSAKAMKLSSGSCPPGASQHEDRCIGSLVGVACGDTLGAGFEFMSRRQIFREHDGIEGIVRSGFSCPESYTDDTEMTLALTTSLIQCGGLDAAHCASTYASFFSSEPR